MADLLELSLRLGLALATLLGLVYLAFALRNAEKRSRRALWLVPAMTFLLFAGIPGLASPLLTPERLRGLFAVASLTAAAWLAVLARRAWRDYARASSSARAATLRDALALAAAEPAGVDVSVRGALRAEPPLVSPLTQTPCVLWRLEVRRSVDAGAPELVALEERTASKLVVAEEGGARVTLAAAVLPTQATRLTERVEEGVVEGDQLAAGAPDERIAQLARKLDPDPPLVGIVAYRFVERVAADGLPAAVAGRMVRRGAEATLLPIGGRIALGSASGLGASMRCAALCHAAVAALVAAVGIYWLWGGR